MVFGTFDILHQGHLNMLEQAKKHGDLIVIIARDDTVKKIKNKKPRYNEKKRQKSIKPYATKVLLGYKIDKYKITIFTSHNIMKYVKRDNPPPARDTIPMVPSPSLIKCGMDLNFMVWET